MPKPNEHYHRIEVTGQKDVEYHLTRLEGLLLRADVITTMLARTSLTPNVNELETTIAQAKMHAYKLREAFSQSHFDVV